MLLRDGFRLGFLLALAAAGCTRAEDDSPRRANAPAVRTDTAAVASAADVEQEMDAARLRILARADSVADALRRVRGLSRKEQGLLRQDVNARQIATARSMGVRAGGESEIQRLVASGRLVELEDSTEYWVVRELDYSVPFVTPDTRALLTEIGQRFHARLDSLGLPRFRMDVTSVMRTPESQAELRRRNSNASRTVSAHEFGTTLDIAHSRFAPPAQLVVEIPSAPQRTEHFQFVEGFVLQDVARRHANALQAELGRVMLEMRSEGKLRVMMERRQAVYHLTVARRMPRTVAAN